MAQPCCCQSLKVAAATNKTKASTSMDPSVSHLKFKSAVEALEGEASGFVAAKGWEIVSNTYPILAVVLHHPRSGRAVEFRFACDSWDELPPSLSLHDPADGRELTWPEWPRGGWAVGEHPGTRKPFLCLPGIREYHSHPSHINDKWEGYLLRGSFRIQDIVDRVDQKFGVSNG